MIVGLFLLASFAVLSQAFHTHNLLSLETVGTVKNSVSEEDANAEYFITNPNILAKFRTYDEIKLIWKNVVSQEISLKHFVLSQSEVITLGESIKSAGNNGYKLPIVQGWSKEKGELNWEASLTRDFSLNTVSDLIYNPVMQVVIVLCSNTVHIISVNNNSPIVMTWSTTDLTPEQQNDGKLFLSNLIAPKVNIDTKITGYQPIAFGCVQDKSDSICKRLFSLNINLESGIFQIDYLPQFKGVSYKDVLSTAMTPSNTGCNDVTFFNWQMESTELSFNYVSLCSKELKKVVVSLDESVLERGMESYLVSNVPTLVSCADAQCSLFKAVYDTKSKEWLVKSTKHDTSKQANKFAKSQDNKHASSLTDLRIVNLSNSGSVGKKESKTLPLLNFHKEIDVAHITLLLNDRCIMSMKNGLMVLYDKDGKSVQISNQAFAQTQQAFIIQSNYESEVDAQTANFSVQMTDKAFNPMEEIVRLSQSVGLIAKTTFRRDDMAVLVTYSNLEQSVSFDDLGLLVHLVPTSNKKVRQVIVPGLPLSLKNVKVSNIQSMIRRRGNTESLRLLLETSSQDVFVWDIVFDAPESILLSNYEVKEVMNSFHLPRPAQISEETVITFNADSSIMYSQGSLEESALLVEIDSIGAETRNFVHYVDASQSKITFYEVQSEICQESFPSNLNCHVARTSSVYQWDASQEKISRVIYNNEADTIHSRVTVLGDDNVLVKYLNPNLMVVITESAATAKSDDNQVSFAAINLVDSVNGRIIKRFKLEHASGPISSVLMENFLFTAYWNSKAKRCELSSIALYEGVIGKYEFIPNIENIRSGKLSLSREIEQRKSSFAPTQIITVERTYIVPRSIIDLQHTISTFGITNKNLLATLDSGEVFSIDLRSVHPRRPLSDPTVAEKEEGLNKYSPLIFLNPMASLTKANLKNDRGSVKRVISAPSSLESSTTVLSFGYGSDVAFFAHYPAQEFDSLPMDFNHPMLILLLVALGAAVLVLRSMSRRSALNRLWT